MSIKPRRIRALKLHITPFAIIHPSARGATEPCYIIRQSEVRALAEQLIVGMDIGFDRQKPLRKPLGEAKQAAVLYALKRAGITPSRAKGGSK